MGLIDGLVIFFSGKRLGVLGERRVGKTVLNKYIREGRLVREYEQTIRADRVRAARPSVTAVDGSGSTRVAIKKGHDVPGDSRTNIDAWRDIVRESDYLLYLFDAHLLLHDSGAHGRRVRAQCETITGFLEDRSTSNPPLPKVVMVGTHCDLDASYVSPSLGTRSWRFYNEVRTQADVDRSSMTFGTVLENEAPVVIGSLATREDADDLVARVFRQEFDL
jgi:hypothetical protein